VPATTPPSYPPVPPTEWLDQDPWLDDGPAAEDPEQITAWLDELEQTFPWADDDPDFDDSGPAGPPEVLKAGFWDRATGDGCGFAAGGTADHLPPGPVLAGLANDRWQAGLGRLSDDELVGVLRAARRLSSWAAAMELAATTDLWRRRTTEEDAGDTGAALHTDDEIAAALTLTRHAAEQALNLAVALCRLPATRAALTTGDIDLPRAKVIADELTGLDDRHAAAVEAAIIGAAPGQTTGQLRAATRQAVQAADPTAARTRKEQALREARVERWTEPAGTAALAGRDLPPAQVLAADANLTALAQQLKAAGGEGTLDTLRAQIYLALLTGTPAASLLPTNPHSAASPGGTSAPSPSSAVTGSAGTTGTPTTGTPTAGPSATDASADTGPASTTGTPTTGPSATGTPTTGTPTAGPSATDASADTGPASTTGTPTTGPSATDASADTGPASTTGTPTTGPSATDASADTGSAGASGPFMTRSPATTGTRSAATASEFPGLGGFPTSGVAGRINLTVPLATWLGRSDTPGQVAGYGPLDAADSRALAHALSTHPGTRWCLTITGPDGRPAAHGCARAGPRAASREGPRAGPGERSSAGSRDRPRAHARARQWTIILTPLDSGDCDHAGQELAYRPSAALRHLVNARHATCVFPGCRRPAAQCDADHTIAYEIGGRTCLCNLAPLCRHHHQTKQAHGWSLDQIIPGTLTWTTPSGRRYTTGWCPASA
jgi:hypothetical protein